MTEISVNYYELKMALQKMNELEKGTGYSIYNTSDLLNHSRGEMYESTNGMYLKLCEIECVMIEIIKKTRLALEQAGVDFESAEKTMINYYNEFVTSATEGVISTIEKISNMVECQVPLYGQQTNYTCGSASGSMILNSLGISVSENTFWNYSNANGQGTYVYRVTATLNNFIGSNIYSYVDTNYMSNEEYFNTIKNSLKSGYPVEVVISVPKGTEFGYWSTGHYVVVTGVYQNDAGEYMAKINDPFSSKGANNPQQLEIKLSDLQKYNSWHSGYIICNK